MDRHVRATACWAILLLITPGMQAAWAGNLLLRQRLQQSGTTGPECRPRSVPADERCAYVIENKHLCYPDGGLQTYIRFHYCSLGNA